MFTTNTEFLKAEMADVLRLFGDVPDVAHTFVYAENNFMNAVIVGGREYDFCERQECAGEIEFKRYARRFAKLALYEALRAETGRSMPWGALTGIRPTKLAYAEQAAGRRFEPLFEKFGVSRENIALVRAVLDAQQGIYAREEGAADLYIGIPFCPSKCDYCSFITADISRTEQYVEGYLSALEKEIAACRGLFRRLKSIYIGGGTPLVLETPQLRRVLDAAAPFAEGQEYTVEAGRPDVFTEEKLRLLKDYGVTRICVNPQTFSDETLARIGRRHTAADIYRAFDMARRFSFDINCDLIAGLPGERAEEFCSGLDKAVALAPENITVHTLCLKKGAKLKEEESRLAGDGIGEMINYSRSALSAAGYVPYYLYRQKYMADNRENTGWTKPGRACVYNIDVMEEITDNIACGANAVGKKLFAGEGRIERIGSPKDIPTYIAKIEGILAEKRKLYG
ncbi:MAG TPA: coproporphyrinogen dehydrogenase HemZ [Candidatus Borkfalkia avicola]|uniref:Coproporphyrinogen dehydrogenase HemZ n=1 Tax=Candidatus Borkfalkia avicola TaxID=2838503 RepID=A0A9D2IIH3_9FIRM|nr:coproporphyrinogen dehydrogenase HemZ [Candidatus Borkfalkia avicola]